jgi:hypothetical protein
LNRECLCSEEKTYHIIFDGGSSGPYSVDLCKKCFDQDDKKWILSDVAFKTKEEKIND